MGHKKYAYKTAEKTKRTNEIKKGRDDMQKGEYHRDKQKERKREVETGS